MTTVLIVPESGCTYNFFRRQLLCLLTRAQARGHDEQRLRATLDDAVRSWRAQGYPASWLLQARSDVLKALDSKSASSPAAAPGADRAQPPVPTWPPGSPRGIA
jgi:hypothetical protein